LNILCPLLDLVGGDGEPLGAVLDAVAPALPVGAELSERGLVADDVVIGDEQVVADRADRLGLTASSAELGE
jgi:hypothetical protein